MFSLPADGEFHFRENAPYSQTSLFFVLLVLWIFAFSLLEYHIDTMLLYATAHGTIGYSKVQAAVYLGII